MRHRAYTLIELLVVVAIIVALLAILLPSMGRAVEVAQRAVCASQQRQTLLACLAYGADTFGQLPPGTAETGGLGARVVYEVGQASVKNLGLLVKTDRMPPQILYCPSSSHPYIQYDVVREDGEQGGWPAPDRTDPPTVRWQANTIYRSRLSADEPRGVRLRDSGGTALTADDFTQKADTSGVGGMGVYVHQQEGYQIGYLDSHVEWYADPSGLLINTAPHGAQYDETANFWSFYFDADSHLTAP